jgi:hypothetical protein
MILHTIGDSHSIYPWNKINIDGLTVKTHHLGSITCASFGVRKLNIVNIKNGLDYKKNPFTVNEGEIVCFCFGEIDCRSHISKPKNLKIYQTLIDEIVLRYFEAINLNVEQYKDLTTLVFNVVPARNCSEHYLKKYGADSGRKFPFFGSNEERMIVTTYMNSKIKEYCEKYQYKFIDIHNKYADENGLLKVEFQDGAVHIIDPKYIEEELKIILDNGSI